ncbi:MAG: Ig-like domain-containing protein, partial [Clostridiales bacterium]|nr:Ig-like domain-containing protein [Clostridiales bacterium]
MRKISSIGFLGYIRAAVAIALVVMLAAVSVGCSFFKDLLKEDTLEFTTHNLSLFVGEKYELSSILDTNASAVKFSSSDSAVVAIDKNKSTITGVAVGAAYITAKTGSVSDRLKVVVSEKEDDSVTVSYSGELVQTLGNTSDVTFTVSATGMPSKSKKAVWYVNNVKKAGLDLDESFTFTPEEVGEFIVYVKCGEMTSDGITVRIFSAVNAEVSVSGAFEQSEPFNPIVFTVTTDSEDDAFFQLIVDGEVVYEGNINTFTYTPSAGRHTLSVKVNGQTEYYMEAAFIGAIVPTIEKVDFDNLYPHAYLMFDAVGKVKVEISTQGKVNEYSQSDSRYAALFDGGAFDIGSLIDVCASGSARQTYEFRIKSLGDNDLFTESDYSDYFTFTQLPLGAKEYIQNVLLCGDHYITSIEEYVALTEYYVYFRQKEANVTVSYDCYIGYDRTGGATDMWDNAFPIAATSGTYSGITVYDVGGGVMRTTFKVDTVNTPTRQLTGTGSERATPLHAILPHINFDASKNRPTDYEFAIDKLTRTAHVAYSDELYLAAQSGVKPIPRPGSPAEDVYAQARKILRSICTDDMTDVEKAHAIYDWIMWQVTYDTPATRVSKSEDIAAYYLEGVFGDGSTSFGGVKYKPYAVCDGMSKAYSLMCNIEGIPCVRVVGEAGAGSSSPSGGHAWNKVFVRGAWYVVDCTWGDTTSTLSINGAAKRYELGLHQYLFLTDADIAATHSEPYKYSTTTVRYTPQTASAPINVYAEMTVNGKPVNACIAAKENMQN